MISFFNWQMDYIYFIDSISFFILATICLIFMKDKKNIPWFWLGLFGAVRGLFEWFDLLSISYGDNLYFSLARVSCLIFAYAFLAEFGRASMMSLRGKGVSRSIFIPLLALVASGGLAGQDGLTASTWCVLGFGGGFCTALFFFFFSKRLETRFRAWLVIASVATVLYVLTDGIVVLQRASSPESLVNFKLFFLTTGFPVQLPQAIFVVLIAVTIYCYSQSLQIQGTVPSYHKIRNQYAIWTVLSLVFVLCLGWVLTLYLDHHASTALREESSGSANALSNYLQGEFEGTEHVVIAMAGSPFVEKALSSRESKAVEQANLVTDRFNGAIGASVCYILDVTGVTIASSNRHNPDSFVGKNYGFRSYFRSALEGKIGRYFAVGATSKERGYYASFPVREENGKIVGVAVIKKNLDNSEQSLSQYPYCFCIDPHGVLFLSSRSNLLFKSLWPIKKEDQQTLLASRQFGDQSFEPILSQEPMDGQYIVFNGKHFLVTRKFINPERWSILLLTPIDYIHTDRLLGIAITLCLSILIIGFFAGAQRLSESTSRIAISEANYRTIFENTGTALAIIEEDTTISMVNSEFTKLSGYSAEEIEGKKSWTEFVTKIDLEKMKAYHSARRSNQDSVLRNYEFNFIDKNGDVKNILLTVALITGTQKSVSSLLDITERKQAEEKLKYLVLHDSLTGIYNRAAFEQRMISIEGKCNEPAAVIICDVDGLKLVNDTLGHNSGDKLLVAAADIFRDCFREGDMVARIGGDEFAVLLPGCDRTAAEKVCQRIGETVEMYNAANPALPLSISVGFALSTEMSANLGDTFKEADNNMYREKLHRSQSARSAIVQTLMKALEARDYITEGHADRLQHMVVDLAMAISLPERRIADLRLLAQFHDIGKVGIPDRILFKPGPLTAEETIEMHRHSEIGYRIAQSSPDLVPIAEWILKHHERWDGKGYPLGIKGQIIPLECRILAIADAYDAMISDRPYRSAMDINEAATELIRNSGTQFDPQLVPMFVQVIKKQKLA